MLRLKELEALEELTAFRGDLIHIKDIARVDVHGRQLPIKAFVIGSQDPTTPSFGLFGGVHGLERVSNVLVRIASCSVCMPLAIGPSPSTQLL